MWRIFAIAAAALVPCLSNADGQGADSAPPVEEPALKLSGWVNPEFESAHITRGRIKVLDPVWNFDCGLRVDTRDFGYLLCGFWSESDLTDHYSDTRRWYFSEIDPIVCCGYKYAFAEGWSADARLGLQWNWMEGYEGARRRSYDEWRWMLSLKTPWLTAYVLTRTFYYPYYAMAFKTGVRSSIPLFGKLTFDPNVWFDGGSERWNRRRFGAHTESHPDYRAGPNSISVQLFLSYRFTPSLRAYGGITQYVAIDPTVRDQVEANPARTARRELLVATAGIAYSF